jgi:hypothetical protein
MELAPCPTCGDRGFSWSDHYLECPGDRFVSRYCGTCDACGHQNEFEFELRRDESAPEGFGGPTPSQIIDPGQFFALARAAAQEVPANPANCDPDEREDAVEAIVFAVAAMEEVVKFVPSGRDAVPPEAFVTRDGKAVYAADPLWFQLDRLNVTTESYRRIKRAYLDSSTGSPS